MKDSREKVFGIHLASSIFLSGGAIFTNDDDLAHTIRGIVNHGMYKRYHHDVVGVNSRLDSIQACKTSTKI